MAKKKSGPGFIIFLLILAFIGAGIGYVFFFTDYLNLTPAKKQVTADESSDSSIFTEASDWTPEVVWGKPKPATKETYYGNVKGTEITGKLVNREGYIDHTEDPEFLKKLGYSEDPNLFADGPGSSMWGYIKHVGKDEQVVLFSYTNEDMHTSSDGPVTSECPCTLELSIFISDVFKPNWQ